MEKLERKHRNEKGTPPAFSFFRGFENNPPVEPDRFRGINRQGSSEYIVDWQMSGKQEEKQQVS